MMLLDVEGQAGPVRRGIPGGNVVDARESLRKLREKHGI